MPFQTSMLSNLSWASSLEVLTSPKNEKHAAGEITGPSSTDTCNCDSPLWLDLNASVSRGDASLADPGDVTGNMMQPLEAYSDQLDQADRSIHQDIPPARNGSIHSPRSWHLPSSAERSDVSLSSTLNDDQVILRSRPPHLSSPAGLGPRRYPAH
ncbi:hypothetical protein BS47DRAFT_1345387 [Hydnum rufescens UP504]|uniref:Uncharacterized protein n=1 Tax=Hydnum rufescens UP504 TaxID=1448309 RepID=A0A9P6DW79_9AGAM|nr:hypothetical protein BS47DRAFT_1345387 [Hydnum rufescens UP504]